uniref:SH3 and PX domain-containing protein 2A isoform X2 n=1 Tax=Myxine glutinosa TaxID=7769 RepID=UPI003590015E
MMSRRTVVDVKVEDVEKRRIPSKHYVYLISVTWSDGTKQLVFRRYSKFFDLQMQLLDQFPMEGGQRDPKLRTIPFLPGKILFRRSHIRDVAVKRLKPISEYCQALVRLPAHISQCPDVLRFFETRQEDLDAHKGFMEKKKNGRGWWFVSGIDEQGWVPASFLEPHKEMRGSPPSRKATDVAKRRRPHLKRLDRRWTLGGFTNRQASRAEVRCIALQPYTAQDKDELSFEKGTSLDVLQQNTEGWWLVRHQGRQGWAPAHHLQRVPEDHTRRRKTGLPPVEIVGTMMDVSNLPGRPWARRGSGGSGGSEPGCRLAGSVPGSSRSPNVVEKTRHTSATEHERKTPSSPAVARIAPQRPSNGSPERSPGSSPRRDASLARGLQLPKPPAPPSVEMEYYTIAEFQTTISDGISFRGGQKLEVIEKCVSGWWYVQIGHDEGWAPASYIEKRKKVNLVRRTSNVTRPKVPPPAPPGRTRASSADGRHSDDRARSRETEVNGRSPSTVREHIYDVPAVDCPDVMATIRCARGNGSPRAVTKISPTTKTTCSTGSESPGSPRPVTATVPPSVITAQSRTTVTRGNPVLLSPRSTPRASVRPRLDSDGSETREDVGRDGCRDVVTGRATLPRSNAQSVSGEMYDSSACLTQGRGVKPSLRPKPMTNYIASNPGGSPGRFEVGTVPRGKNEAGPGSEKKEGGSEEIVNGIRTLGEAGSKKSGQSSQASGGQNGTGHIELSGKGEPYRAVARFEKVQNSELCLNEGDEVDVLEKKDGGWWFVRSGVDEGWVPASYLETRLYVASTGSISRRGLGSQVPKAINGTDPDQWRSQDNSLPPKRPPPPKLSPSMGRHGGRRLPAPIEKSIRMENLESYSGARCHPSPSSRILEKVKTLPAANHRASSSMDMNGAQRSSPRLSRRDPRDVFSGTRRDTQMHQTSSGGSSPRERTDVSTMENGTLSLGRSRSDRLQSRTFLGQALRAELISRPMPLSGDVYVAIADYAGDDETLGFDEGVSLEVIERHPNGWWYCKVLDGRCEDSEGWAPSNYLERKVLLGGRSLQTRHGEDSKKEPI